MARATAAAIKAAPPRLASSEVALTTPATAPAAMPARTQTPMTAP
jgi:hypothetical protein